MAINFNAIVEEFKRTNWQDPGTWHAAPKVLVLVSLLVAIPVAGFFADTQGQIEELERGQADEVKLKDEYLKKKQQAVNLDLHRQQLREIDTQFGALLRQLPRIVTLSDVKLEAGKDGILTMDATARTYRYLADEEVAAQRKAASKKGPAKK